MNAQLWACRLLLEGRGWYSSMSFGTRVKRAALLGVTADAASLSFHRGLAHAELQVRKKCSLLWKKSHPSFKAHCKAHLCWKAIPGSFCPLDPPFIPDPPAFWVLPSALSNCWDFQNLLSYLSSRAFVPCSLSQRPTPPFAFVKMLVILT